MANNGQNMAYIKTTYYFIPIVENKIILNKQCFLTKKQGITYTFTFLAHSIKPNYFDVITDDQ